MATRKLVYVPVGDLVPAVRNPKAHDLAALRQSFARFGFVEPITEDGRTGRLVSGHGRLEMLSVLEALGDRPEEWPEGASWPPEGVSVVKDRWAVPVVRGWSSRDDAEAEAFLVAANRITIAGGWDSTELADLLSELSAGSGLEGTGYSEDDLGLLLAELAGKEEPTAPDDWKAYDEDMETAHACPRCGYTWSGSSKQTAAAVASGDANL